MNLKSLVCALGFVVALAPALAADRTIDLSTGSASFGSTLPLLDGGDDVITFSGLAAGFYDFTVSFTSQFIPNIAGSLNGDALTVNGISTFRFGYLEDSSASPLLLTLTGTPNGNTQAQYAVTMSATPAAVPEPESIALLFGGLAMVGVMGGRSARKLSAARLA